MSTVSWIGVNSVRGILGVRSVSTVSVVFGRVYSVCVELCVFDGLWCTVCVYSVLGCLQIVLNRVGLGWAVSRLSRIVARLESALDH